MFKSKYCNCYKCIPRICCIEGDQGPPGPSGIRGKEGLPGPRGPQGENFDCSSIIPTPGESIEDTDKFIFKRVTNEQCELYCVEYDQLTTDVGSNISFLDLTDTPNTYDTNARKLLTVSDNEQGLVYITRQELFNTDNLISNPSFESWSIANPMPDDWINTSSGGSSFITRETTITYNGSIALRFNNVTGIYTNNTIRTGVRFNVPALGTLIAEVYGYRTISNSNTRVRFRIYYYDSDNNPIPGTYYIANNNGAIGLIFNTTNVWQYFISKNTGNTPIPANAYTAELELQLNSTTPTTDVILDGLHLTAQNARLSIDELNDVTITNVQDGQILQYNSATQDWINTDLSVYNTLYSSTQQTSLTQYIFQKIEYDAININNSISFNMGDISFVLGGKYRFDLSINFNHANISATVVIYPNINNIPVDSVSTLLLGSNTNTSFNTNYILNLQDNDVVSFMWATDNNNQQIDINIPDVSSFTVIGSNQTPAVVLNIHRIL